MNLSSRRRSVSRLAALLVPILVLAACGGGNNSDGTSTPGSDLAINKIVAPEATTIVDVIALERPVVIAHAGGDFDWPHSTMYAFTQAALNGTDVLEMDVMLSSDGVLMVQHDNTVDRLTNSTGLVSSYTAAELQAMDNAYWFSGGVWSDKSLAEDAYIYRGVRTGEVAAPAGFTADDFGIPTFEQVARAFPDFALDVEIKIPESESGEVQLDSAMAAAKELARLITELDRADSVIVVSFNDDVLAEFRSLIPDVATSPGQTSLLNWYLEGTALHPRDLVIQAPPFYGDLEVLNKETFDRAHADGYKVWVWMTEASQETTEYFNELLSRGADGLLVAAVTAIP
jgi:glycerophosphoryl diester phosphodiesterase